MSDFNYRGKLPFRVVSSSVNTGYNAELTAAVGHNIEIVNEHLDHYAGLQDSPAQGPFTEQWVGGNQHRHVDLNDGTDNSTNRPEAFLISGSTDKVRVYAPTHFNINAPKALFTRDNASKSPVNLKNIRNESRRLGNFSHNYQVVQTSGRDINQSLIENNLTASGVLTTKFIKFPEGNFGYNPPVPATAFLSSFPNITFTAIPQGDDCGNALTINFQIEPEMPGDSSIIETGTDITVLSTGSLTLYQFLDFVNNPSSWLSGVPKCIASSFLDDTILFTFAPINFDGGTDGFTSGVEGDDHVYTLPEEPNNKTVFVERFSAPGDWKESSRGALDRESEQYAPNNSLVTRNISVRQKLSSQLTQHMPQFGSGSTYALLPLTGTVNAVTENKVNRNAFPKLKDTGTQIVTITGTAATLVHGTMTFTCVSSGIAGNNLTLRVLDLQPSDSITVVGSNITLNFSGDGGTSTGAITALVNNPANWPSLNQLFTVSVSFPTSVNPFGPENFSGGIDDHLQTQTIIETSSFYDNFNVQHAIPSTDLRYSWIADSVVNTGSIVQYQNPYNSEELIFNSSSLAVSGANKQFEIDNIGINSLIKNKKSIDLLTNTFNVSSSAQVSASFSEMTNAPYGFSTWKQIRGSEHPVVRKLRENNIFSIEGIKSRVIRGIQLVSKRSDSVNNIVEPPVTNRFRPLKQTLELKGSNEKYQFTFTHNNNLSTIVTKELLDYLGIKEDSQQTYDLLRKYYTDPSRTTNLQNPVNKLTEYVYTETFYPREINTYIAETRGRTAYILTQSGFTRDGFDTQLGTQRAFWRDSTEDRRRSKTSFFSSMSQSIFSRNSVLTEEGQFIFVNSDDSSSVGAIGYYDTTQTFKNEIYLDSVHTVDNNTDNNANRFISDTTAFITSVGSENVIFTKQLDNGNSGELNGEIFLDYTYSDVKNAVATVPAVASFIPTKGHPAAEQISTPNFEILILEQDAVGTPASGSAKVIVDAEKNAGYDGIPVGTIILQLQFVPEYNKVPPYTGFDSVLSLFQDPTATTPIINVLDLGDVFPALAGHKAVIIRTTASVDTYNSPAGNITNTQIANLLNNPSNWPDNKQYISALATGGNTQVIGEFIAEAGYLVSSLSGGTLITQTSPSNVKLTEILPSLLSTPIPRVIRINYGSSENAIHDEGGDPNTWIIDITGSTVLTTLEFIDFVNDTNNWKTDPFFGPTSLIDPVFSASIASPTDPTTYLIYWNDNQNLDSGGTEASGIVEAAGTAIINFQFIPVGTDSGNGWTVSLENGPTSNISEVGQNITIYVTSSIDSSLLLASSFLGTDLVNFVNNPLNWLSGVPKFTATTPYNFVSIVADSDVFSGGTDGVAATPRVKGQLVRVTEHSVLTQFEQRVFLDAPHPIPAESKRSYVSYSNMFIEPPLPFFPRKYVNIPSPRPKYTAFLGGFESGSRDYTIIDGPGGQQNLDNYGFFTNQPSGTIKSTLDAGLRYAIEEMSGKKPWFDSYEKYAQDIRFVGQEYSIIPEFKISSHIPYYVKEKGGNFSSKNSSIFELDGSDSVRWKSSMTQSNTRYDQTFIDHYVVSEPSKNAWDIDDENKTVSKIEKISFKISGIKKLLPYNGFYPQERTIQLANLFNEYMDNNVGGGYFRLVSTQDSSFAEIVLQIEQDDVISTLQTDLYKLFAKNTVMPYFFAPGILYNTIKSGISVDFPAITASSDQLLNIKDSENKSDGMSIFEEIPFSLVKNAPPEFTGSLIANGFLNARFPFESLIFPSLAIPYNSKISSSFTTKFNTDLEAKKFFDDTLSGTLFNIKMDAYAHPDKFYIDEVAIGRGWRRTVPFAYMKNDKIIDPSYSMAMSNFLAEIPRFFLLNEQMNVFRSSEIKNWKNFDTNKKYYLDLKMRKSNDLVMIESYTSNQHVQGDSIQKTMNGRYFGWPVNKTTGSFLEKTYGGVHYGEMYSMHNDPAYAPFTPPYFEGEATLRLELTPTKEIYSSVKEMFNDIDIIDIFPNLQRNIDTGSDAYKFKMSIEDCLTIRGIGKNKEVSFDTLGNPNTVSDTIDSGREYWAISPKLETPVLDFSKQVLTAHTGAYWISDGYGRGMWSGYGEVPTGSKGIILELAESFPLEKELRYRKINSKLTGSLLEQMGFKPEAKKIGQLAQRKTISEAIVAIPFVDRAIEGVTTFIDGHHFFAINPFIFDSHKKQVETNKLENGETSITKMISLMKQYVIPPNLDFLTYYRNPNPKTIRDNRNGIDPFVMYLFEFRHDLDQQDLSDIWQGVLPKIGTTAEKEQISFSHNIGENELFGADFQVPKNMRWMIFKVKKKAEWNYYAVTENKEDDQTFQFNFANSEIAKTPEYSYNWPYDYFSLVELAKVEIGLTYDERTQPLISGSTNLDINQFAIGNVSDFADLNNTGRRPRRRRSGRNQKADGILGKKK